MQPIPFDKREGYIWYNNSVVDWSAANTHILNHGLHYASSVFEGIRVYNGKIFKLHEHNQRLHRSAELLGFKIPYSVQELDDATEEIVKTQKIQNGYIRSIAWRGSEQMAILTTHSKIHVAIACWQWPSYYSDAKKLAGLRLCLAEWQKPSPQTAPTASKAAGLYMIATLSKNKANEDGYDDALMLDWRGYIAEGTGANIFLKIGGELHTPIADCFLNGITRQTIISLAKEMGVKVIERRILPTELEHTEEVFFTGSAAEVTPIKSININGNLYSFKIGEDTLTRSLMQQYKNLVGA